MKGAGCIGTVLIGIAGGILGGIIFSAAGGEGINEFSFYSLLVAFVGATLLLFVYGALTGGGRRAQLTSPGGRGERRPQPRRGRTGSSGPFATTPRVD